MDKKMLCILALFILAPISCSDNSSRTDNEADAQSTSRPAIGKAVPAGGEAVKILVSRPFAAADETSGATERQSAAGYSPAQVHLPAGRPPAAEAMHPQPDAQPSRIKLPVQWNRESYDAIEENRFINAFNDPLSTFSIDVDTASYANVRRFISGGSLPPAGAVRAEEMINYFRYELPEPDHNQPFSLQAEVGPSPFHAGYKLVRIGLRASDIEADKLPPSNLVFLVDVSGSMNQPDKLPLLKQSLKLLAKKLTRKDRLAMVVYAGSDRVVLPPTPGDDFDTIVQAVDNLHGGGSTHASSGIVTAYELAARSFIPGGNNRVILVSDGDFNVGVTSRSELQTLIEERRQSGVYLTVLGFGSGNYHDDTMEILADKGNGNYAYIDSLLEAKKVLIKERSGTLFTLARDVKIQVEFNPALVGAYRLIGYENRSLADEDFRHGSLRNNTGRQHRHPRHRSAAIPKTGYRRRWIKRAADGEAALQGGRLGAIDPDQCPPRRSQLRAGADQRRFQICRLGGRLCDAAEKLGSARQFQLGHLSGDGQASSRAGR